MKKKIQILCILIPILGFSQNKKGFQRIIDSINQKRIDSVSVNLDSLANPKLTGLKALFKDTVVIRSNIYKQEFSSEIPVTPYNLLQQTFQKRWFFMGQNNFVFNEASYSNWNTGGNNNIGINAKINYNISYKHKDHYLENIFQLGYGTMTSKGQSSRKTDDNINIVVNYGYDLKQNYYLSAGFQFLSQFAPGYRYDLTPDPSYANRISKFMAPAYINTGLGISYNPNENFQFVLRPANAKFTIVTDPLLQKAGKYGLERDGQHLRSEIGAMLNAVYRLKIFKEMNFVSQLNFFSNYINHPERVDVSYNGVLNVRFNKYISTIVSLNLVYDHDQIQKLQMKQTIGIGFSHNFGVENPLKSSGKKVIKPFVAG